MNASTISGFILVVLILLAVLWSRTSVESDVIGSSSFATSGGDLANSSLADLPVLNTPMELVGHAQKPTHSSVANLTGLIGKDLLDASSLRPIQDNSPAEYTPIERAGNRILPAVVDPATYLRTNISVMKNASRDIRGDPEIPLSGPPPAAMPTIGPYQPQLKTLRVSSHIDANTPTPDNTTDFFGVV